MANFITIIRIICSFALLFFPALSVPFYALYITAGISDTIDGTVARKTGTVSEFGSKLDTAADFIMAAICFIKFIPILDIDIRIYIWIGIIAIIKAINIATGIVVHKRFVSVHSVMNKIAGALLFLLPLTIIFIDLRYSAAVICAIATFAAIQEWRCVRSLKNKRIRTKNTI